MRMETRVFKARTVREALKKVSAALGAEAMIVSQVRREGHVEVTARIGGDESAAPAAAAPGLGRERIRERLAALGFSADFIDSALTGVGARSATEVASAVRGLLPLSARDATLAHGRIRLIGPPGAGKTTNAIRIALGHVLAHGRGGVALVTEDTARLGGSEALVLAGELLDVPVLEARDADERAKALDTIEERALIVIDTEGLGAAVPTELPGFETVLVLPATARDDVISGWLQRAKDVASGVLLTQADCVATHGALLSALWREGLPLWWIAAGNDAATGIERADADAVWRLIGGDVLTADAASEALPTATAVPAAPQRRRELAVV